MRSVAVAEHMTADEYLGAEWRPHTELIAGELVVNSPGWPHQVVCSRIYLPLSRWWEASPGRGYAVWDLDVKLGDRDVYRPDILWFRHERLPAANDVRPFPVPDLAVEVRSPSTWRFDIGRKKARYEARGLPELWLVDTEADVLLAFRRSTPAAPDFDVALELESGATLTSPLLPGLALPLDRVFGELPGRAT